MAFYFSDFINKTNCVGNALSTINLDLSSLDIALHELSTYNTTTIDVLSANIDILFTNTETISTDLIELSTYTNDSLIALVDNVPSFTQNTIVQDENGIISYDFATDGDNVYLEISANCFFDNISSISSGQYGQISIHTFNTSGVSVTGWGDQWQFHSSHNSFTINPDANNLIQYYYQGNSILARLFDF